MNLQQPAKDYLSAIGSKGGRSKSPRKTAACRLNGAKGGQSKSEAKREAAKRNGAKRKLQNVANGQEIVVDKPNPVSLESTRLPNPTHDTP